MEQILVSSLTGYGSSFVEPRVELGARFGHLLRASPSLSSPSEVLSSPRLTCSHLLLHAERFLDIHQISLALATLLSKDNSLLQIINSFEAINFESVRNHVALVSYRVLLTLHPANEADSTDTYGIYSPTSRCATAAQNSSCRSSRSTSARC